MMCGVCLFLVASDEIVEDWWWICGNVVLLIVFMILFHVMDVEVFCGCYVLAAVAVVAWITAEVFYGAVAFDLMFVGCYELVDGILEISMSVLRALR